MSDDQPWAAGARMIGITGDGKGTDERRFREAGFHRHLAKPLECGALVTLINRLLDGLRGPT